jgi:cytochrome c-type biogenesis protein CcmH
MRAMVLSILLVLASQSAAVEPGERLANPALEARARSISTTLRCLVCQNESIDDSNAELAHDIRVLVRQRLLAGDTDTRVRQAIVDRYGQFVLLNPPVRPATYLLWFGPVAMLVIGFVGVALWLRRRDGAVVDTRPLNEDERRRLDTLLREVDH